MSPFLTQVILHLTATSYAAKHCCYKTTFFSLGCVYQKCLLPRAFNKALLFHPGLSMTMTWFPWDFYGNWLILCNLIKALGVHFFLQKKKNSGWKYGALLKIGGLAATWQAGHNPCIDPLHREYRHTHTLSLSAHFTNLLQFHGLCRVFFPLLP